MSHEDSLVEVSGVPGLSLLRPVWTPPDILWLREGVAVALAICPVSLREANAFVGEHHRHHKPVVGHKFSIGAAVNDALVGVVIVGRPVARKVDYHAVAEVTRLATDGTPHACSLLYAAAARAAKAMGYKKIQTYTLESEPGTSLRAAGWTDDGLTKGGQWKHTAGPRRTDQPICPKRRWIKTL